jgi:hypothetical protein
VAAAIKATAANHRNVSEPSAKRLQDKPAKKKGRKETSPSKAK